MSFEDWVKNGWLEVHKSSKEEIANLLGIVERDLKDSKSKDVSNDCLPSPTMLLCKPQRPLLLQPAIALRVTATITVSSSRSP